MAAPAVRDAAGPGRVLGLGIGNLLWADEGFGVRAVEALHQRVEMPEHSAGGRWRHAGPVPAGDICDHAHVLVFDAIDYHLPPGTLRVLRDAEVPVWSEPR